jgi:secreted trypsin-like serine protease
MPSLQKFILFPQFSIKVKDSICSGDSGGPLVVKINGMNYLMGEASWANGDCENYSPGLGNIK